MKLSGAFSECSILPLGKLRFEKRKYSRIRILFPLQILQDPKQDIFQNLSAKTKQSVRKLSIDMVLATDMSKHMDLIGN